MLVPFSEDPPRSWHWRALPFAWTVMVLGMLFQAAAILYNLTHAEVIYAAIDAKSMSETGTFAIMPLRHPGRTRLRTGRG